MGKIRVLVVDDAVVMRRLISDVLSEDPDIEVVGVAANGRIALQKLTQVNPDVVTMDMEMPEMDGIATVRELRRDFPRLPVIMFSTLTSRGAAQTLDALSAGATDYVTKPANVGCITEGISRLRQDLIPKIKSHVAPPSFAPAAPVGTIRKSTAPVASVCRSGEAVGRIDVVAVGTSTGGPNALADVFSAIDPVLPVPVVIVQHMPPLFTAMLAERLDKIGRLRFHEGAEGMRLEKGHAYLAPGGKHMFVRRDGTQVVLGLNEEPPENSCRPAVDVLFRSVAQVYGAASLGVILTGMGQDGLRGCENLTEAGARIIAQDRATSVVWGMPGFVAQAGLAERVVPLEEVAGEINRRVKISADRYQRPALSRAVTTVGATN